MKLVWTFGFVILICAIFRDVDSASTVPTDLLCTKDEKYPNDCTIKGYSSTVRQTVRIKNFNGTSQVKVVFLDSSAIIAPYGIFTNATRNMTTLFMNKMNLEVIEDVMFENAVNLELFSATKNKLKELTSATFGKIRTLEYLYLSHNQISKITGGTFAKLENLKEIHLDDNKLTSIPENDFNNKMTKFILNKNLKLKIPKDYFSVKKFPNLQEVDLSGNDCGKQTFNTSKSITDLTKALEKKVCSGGSMKFPQILTVLLPVFITAFYMNH